jgi:hypothetical protein
MWITVAITATGMFLGGIPYALTEYSQVGSFVTPETMAALQAQDIPPQQYALVTVISLFVRGLIWVTVGLVIFVRKPADGLALIVSLTLVTFGTQTALRGSLVEAVPALSSPGQILTVISWGLLALFFALFPNGHFVPGWLRWFVVGWTVRFVLPTKILERVPEAATGLFFFAFWVVFLWAQIYRYVRVSTTIERQQTKWVFLGLILLFALFILLFIFVWLEPEQSNSPYLLILGNSILVVIPLSIGIAILKSRLWDIDIIIRRTLQYSILTGLLALVYFGGVVLFQAIFRTASGETSSLAIVLSTLIIAALFTPLRRRVQNLIDRRFFRQKYDAAKVLADFARTARDETDINQLTTRLVEVVQETLQPGHVSLWLKENPQTKR